MSRQSQIFSWPKFIMVFCTTAFIFLLGMVTNSMLNDFKLNEISESFEELRVEAATLEVEYAIFRTNPCEIDPTLLSDQLDKLGSRLNFMESQLGFEDPDVIRLKEFYSLMEIRHWLITEQVNKECSRSHTSILFFYADKGKCSNCEEQGYVLNAFRKTQDNVSIYSFDANLENPALDALKLKYNITSVPTIVFENTTKSGLQNLHSVSEFTSSKDRQS